MYKLIIDTSTKFLYLCLLKDDKIVEEYLESSLKEHAKKSIYQIEIILKKQLLTIDDISELICGYGPGSYTGVRIAVCFAKVLCSIKKIELKAISSLYLMSSGYDDKNIYPMLDARRGNYFCASYGDIYLVDKLRQKEEFMALIDENNGRFVYEDDFKVNPLKVVEKANPIENIDNFLPNYLRIPEAEYNLEHKND